MHKSFNKPHPLAHIYEKDTQRVKIHKQR